MPCWYCRENELTVVGGVDEAVTSATIQQHVEAEDGQVQVCLLVLLMFGVLVLCLAVVVMIPQNSHSATGVYKLIQLY